MNPDISAIITLHAEGELLINTYKSLLSACDHAESLGICCEILVCTDNPTRDTVSAINSLPRKPDTSHDFSFGDQGKVRNEASKLAKGETIAFIDGDDLWSFNWLSEAWMNYLESNNTAIIHPEFNWFFEDNDNIFIHIDQRDSIFDPEYLRIGNYWDALCLAKREIYLDIPFLHREISLGFAYEDWNWNNRTFAQGIPHHVAKNTIHFKRRRRNSQHAEASARGVLPRPCELNSYLFWED